MPRVLIVGALVALAAALLLGAGPTPGAHAGTPYSIGQVFVGAGNGKVKIFQPDGTLVDTLDTTTGAPEITGMAFDAAGNLYVTSFAASTISKFDNAGNLINGTYITGINSHAESISFDAAGNMYVGVADGDADVRKYDAAGNLLDSFDVQTGDRGSDWIDLAADQCTLYYSSEGPEIFRYNVCTQTQLTPLITTLPQPCYALRVLSDGGAIIACSSKALRIDAAGNVTKQYTDPSANNLFAMNLDADGVTFWTANFGGEVFRFNIETGALVSSFNSTPFVDVAGLAVFGEQRAATGGGGGAPRPTATPRKKDCIPSLPGLICGGGSGSQEPPRYDQATTPVSSGETPAATATEAATPAPAASPVPTSPTGGRAGVISAPDTGSGGHDGRAAWPWAAALALAGAALGLGATATLMRQRR
jgi:DNA-binding beta-propeller fold protein YncE